MKQYTAEINTQALDVALEALFKTQGRDDAKRVYELLNAAMTQVWTSASEAMAVSKTEYFNTQIDQINAGWTAKADEAKTRAYEEGVASVLFKQEIEKLTEKRRNSTRDIGKDILCEETALVNAASALG